MVIARRRSGAAATTRLRRGDGPRDFGPPVTDLGTVLPRCRREGADDAIGNPRIAVDDRVGERVPGRLEREHGIGARVIDLRWIAPLPIDDVLDHARAVGKLLVVDECRRSGNVSEALAAAVLDAETPCRFMRVNAADSFVPLGDAANLVLVSEQEILDAAVKLARVKGYSPSQ